MRRVFLSPPLGFMRPASRLDFSQKPRLKRSRWETPVKRRASDVRGDLRASTKAGKVRRVSQARKIPETEAGGDRRIHRYRSLLEQAHERPPAVSFELARRKGDRPLAHAGRASCCAGKGPLRGIRGLPSARWRDHGGYGGRGRPRGATL